MEFLLFVLDLLLTILVRFSGFFYGIIVAAVLSYSYSVLTGVDFDLILLLIFCFPCIVLGLYIQVKRNKIAE